MLTPKGKMVMLIAMNDSKMMDRYLGFRFRGGDVFADLLINVIAERDSRKRTSVLTLEERRKAQDQVNWEPCLTAKGIALAQEMMVAVDMFVEWYLEALPERKEDGLALSTREERVRRALLIEALTPYKPLDEALEELFKDDI